MHLEILLITGGRHALLFFEYLLEVVTGGEATLLGNGLVRPIRVLLHHAFGGLYAVVGNPRAILLLWVKSFTGTPYEIYWATDGIGGNEVLR